MERTSLLRQPDLHASKEMTLNGFTIHGFRCAAGDFKSGRLNQMMIARRQRGVLIFVLAPGRPSVDFLHRRVLLEYLDRKQWLKTANPLDEIVEREDRRATGRLYEIPEPWF